MSNTAENITSTDYVVPEGFVFETSRIVDEMNIELIVMKHVKTGAVVYRMKTDDSNNLVQFKFRTPPTNNKGINHIIEHSLLLRSEKYRTKEPFSELLKSSMNTYLNAFTGSDYTGYVFASQIGKDLHNLCSVYLDCVFRPELITNPKFFQQEGFHIHNEGGEGEETTVSGIVFNEMKGYYSDPDFVIWDQIERNLFPDTSIGFESGGDPIEIMDLTYEELIAYYNKYYHPSNAAFYLYGNDDIEQLLPLIDEYISEHEAINVDFSRIPYQDAFTEPRTIDTKYMFDTAVENRNYMGVGWAMPADYTDDLIFNNFAIDLVGDALFSSLSSEGQKALVDTGIVTKIHAHNDETNQQPMFIISGKDSSHELHDFDVFSILQSFVDNGPVSQELFMGVMNRMEFQLRQMDSAESPRGNTLISHLSTFHLYERDIKDAFKWNAALERLNADVRNGCAEIRAITKRFLIDNPHRVSVIIRPDPTVFDAVKEKEKAVITAELEERSLEEIIASTKELLEMQARVDTPEELATIPRLSKEDLPTEPKLQPYTVINDSSEYRLTHVEQHTDGINYVTLVFPIEDMPASDILLLQRAFHLLTTVDTENFTSDELSAKQMIHFGTFYVSLTLLTDAETLETRPAIKMHFTHLNSETEHIPAFIEELVKRTDYSNLDKVLTQLKMHVVNFENGLKGAGSRYARMRSAAKVSKEKRVEEELMGVSAFFVLKDYVKRVEAGENIFADVQVLIDKVFAVKPEIIISTDDLDQQKTLVQKIMTIWPEKRTLQPRIVYEPLENLSEAYIIPGDIVFNAISVSLVDNMDYKFSGKDVVLRNALGDTMWNIVRVQHGAYGAFATSNRPGVMTFSSYRDPSCNTLDVMQKIAHSFIQEYNGDFDGLVSGAISTYVPHRPPKNKHDFCVSVVAQNLNDNYFCDMVTGILNTTESELLERAEAVNAIFEDNNKIAVTTFGTKQKVAESDRYDRVISLFEQ
ncbi:hypothetical protein PCE1_003360 [Barthelona sp. PCE]